MPEPLNFAMMNSHGAADLVAAIVEARTSSPLCLTCSFQAEDMIVLHLATCCARAEIASTSARKKASSKR